MVRTTIERSPIGYLQLAVVEARIARHERLLRVDKADSRSILKRVTDELGTVSFFDLYALETSDDRVLSEYVVLGPPRISDFGCVRP